jgi:predicted MFS family arabinose efflux permease
LSCARPLRITWCSKPPTQSGFERLGCDNIAVADADARADGFRWDRLTSSVALGYCLLVVALSAGVVLGELREEFGIGGFVAALHGSTFGIGLLVMSSVGVPLIRKLGRPASLRLAVVGMTVGATLFGLGQSWPVTLTGAAIAGVAASLLVVVIPGLIHDHHGENRSDAFAAVNGLPLVMGLVLSVTIGVSLALEHDWRPSYLVLLALTVVALVTAGWRVELPRSVNLPPLRASVFRERDVLVPWLFIVNGVLVEFVVAVWAASYLKEVGGASSGLAPALAGGFAVMMFVSRIRLPWIVRHLGDRTIAASFVGAAIGATIMCFVPSLSARFIGLLIIGFSAGPLYPLTVERLYVRAEAIVGGVGLGAVSGLASGTAITVGPILAGLVADAVGLRWSMLITIGLGLLGAITQFNSPHRPPTQVVAVR